MREFVDKEGNVFHKGVEQPKLKGTLKPTEPKPEKKKLTKREKDELRTSILQQMNMVRGNLKTAKYKKDIRSNNVKMRKLEMTIRIIALTFILPSIYIIMYHGVYLNKFTLYNVGGAI